MSGVQPHGVEVFYSYAHADEALRDELEKHLTLLQRQGYITQWYDRRIDVGTEWAHTIDAHLNAADLILLLISPDFIASDYCYTLEMVRALERHDHNDARVIPIILRPVDWQSSPFGKLQALPTNGKPITTWRNRDEAFLAIAKGIRAIIEDIQAITVSVAPLRAAHSSSAKGLWHLPYRRNPFFTNRDVVFQSLRRALQASHASAPTQALSGMSGMGKTQAAVEYAYRHRDDYQYVLWVTSDTQDTLITDVVTLAHQLDLPEKEARDQHATVQAIKRWLQQHTDWLLILDNADNLSVVRDFIPLEVTGHILLTTQAYALGGLAQRVELGKMGPEEGALFLLRRAKLLAPDESLEQAAPAVVAAAKTICYLVDGLPLALDQAGAYIEEVACSLQEYITLYQAQQTALLRWRGDTVSDHPEPTASTLALSFQKVEQANPAAADLLRFCAFLQPDAIPEEIISLGAAELGPVLQTAASDPFQRNALFGELLKFSLIHRDPTTRTLAIHRLTQVVVRDAMDESMQRQWVERVIRAVNRVFPNPRFFDTWEECQRCLPDAQVCAELIERWDITLAEAIQLLNRTGYYLMRRGRYDEALVFYQQALARGKQVLGEQHVDVAETLYRLGELAYIQGKYSEAEPLYQQALSLREQLLGLNHPDVAQSFHNLALLYYEQRRLAETEQMYLRALSIWEQTLGPDHPDVAECLNNLAALYRVQKRYAEAEPLLRRSLAIREKAFGENNPDTVLGVHVLGMLFVDQGKYAEAEELLQQGLRMCEQVLGRDHPYLAGYMGTLGRLFSIQKRYLEAEGWYQKAIVTGEKALGRDHPYVISHYNALAEMYRTEQKYPEAEAAYQQVLSRQEQTLDSNHPKVATILSNLAELYRLIGAYEKAESSYQRALAIRESTLGLTHPEVAALLEQYALLLHAMQRDEQAAAFEARARTIREQNRPTEGGAEPN
jgi:tetratricopeptide (TPR) repeat protein